MYLSPELDSTKSRISASSALESNDLPVVKPEMSVESVKVNTTEAVVNVAVHVESPVTATVVALAYTASGVSPELHVQREKR
jgi:hypothetical protein